MLGYPKSVDEGPELLDERIVLVEKSPEAHVLGRPRDFSFVGARGGGGGTIALLGLAFKECSGVIPGLFYRVPWCVRHLLVSGYALLA